MTMEKLTVLTGVAAPLLVPNVNTDVIIRIERMSKHARGELGPWALEALRLDGDGRERPEFILNQAPFRDARILLAGANFGCGSSREMAVWALQERGLSCIIAPSFGDIFFNNCLQNGVLAIRLPAATILRIATRVLRGGTDATLTVDLERQEIRHAGEVIAFDVEPLARHSLLLGLDPIAVTMQREPEIIAFQDRDRVQRPWLYG
jgi:3-isopropylmalate/(R)-2-methylmalate dehydratase small subunit